MAVLSSVFVASGSHAITDWALLLVPVFLASLLVLGYSTSRYLLAAVYGYAGYRSYEALSSASVWFNLLLLVVIPLYGWAAWLLVESPSVEAYFEHQRRIRSPSLSLKGDKGV